MRRERTTSEATEASLQSLREEESKRKSAASEIARLERLQLLKALFMSSDEYAIRQQETGTEQQVSASTIREAVLARRYYDLAWDSFKLAVNYYMKAETLAEELDNMDASAEASPGNTIRIRVRVTDRGQVQVRVWESTGSDSSSRLSLTIHHLP